MNNMQDLALQHWLQLTLGWRINAAQLKTLFTRAGSVQALRHMPPPAYADLELSEQASISFAAWQRGAIEDQTRRMVDAALAWAIQPGNHIIPYGAADYPHLLSTCLDPPPQLFVQGRMPVLQLPQLAMVGSRKPTADGRRLARRFARELVDYGYQVTSGLALGIDAESHEGTLEGQGVTIAVLGSGLNRVYPPSHAKLARRIAETGALVSEFPPDTVAHAWHFPERNRIISGLSHGVLVVEAAERSGSLITARVAAEQGREVFAIPGSINNPLARGCHSLIRQGAKLVESAADILAELPALVAWERDQLPSAPRCAAETKAEVPAAALPAHAGRVLEHVAYDPVSVDSLALRTALPMPELLGCLLQLEMLGLVSAREGAYVLGSAER
jgi:DNA processing protein